MNSKTNTSEHKSTMAEAEDNLQRGARVLVEVCGEVKPEDHVLVLSTKQTFDLATIVTQNASQHSKNVVHMILPEADMHGNEPSDSVAGAMYQSDLVFCMTPMSLAHTQARKKASANRTRFLSLPDYAPSVLASRSLAFNFKSLGAVVNFLAGKLDTAKTVKIVSAAGTDIELSIEGRRTNRCPGFVRQPGELGSPPDAEVNLAPNEHSATGVLVVDGSVPCKEIGVLEKPVKLHFKDGKVVNITTDFPEMNETITKLHKLFDAAIGTGSGGDPRRLGEFGIGLNPYSVLCGSMLEDEGAYRTAHFGIGSNATIGGKNDVAFHLDFIFRNPSVYLDGNVCIMEHGELTGIEMPG